MAMKVKRKKRRGRSSLQGNAKRTLTKALERISPRPTVQNWRDMAGALARQQSSQFYVDRFIGENEGLSWEWAALWLCHAKSAESGQVDLATQVYEALITSFPRDFTTEMSRGMMFRDFEGKYVLARDHMGYGLSLWPEAARGNMQMGILYDMLGMPELAFAYAERAYEFAGEQFGEESYKQKARISFNLAVAMWQAARPYGDIKSYLRRALDDWPDYERAEEFLDSLPENNEGDPKGRNSMQRFNEDLHREIKGPSYQIIEPDEE